MLLTVSDFRRCVKDNLPQLILDLQEQTGRRGLEEAAAWAVSLPLVSAAFQDPVFQPLHVYFGENGRLSLEYRLPASASWCDMVLLGAHAGQSSAAVIELKHWDTRGDRPGPVDSLIERQGMLDLHPADQVRGYVEYCKYFHSAVASTKTSIHGCVVFTRDEGNQVYSLEPHQALTKDFPCFSVHTTRSRQLLAEYLGSKLTEPDPTFAEKFETGWYMQDRSFVRNIGETLARSTARPLVLLDNQRFGFALAKAEIEKAVFDSKKKHVLIVEGPPGSGKSVIAAKIWASLAADRRLDEGQFVITTTSSAQETNWRHLVRSVLGHHGASGIVLPANRYAPGTLQELVWWKTNRTGTLKPPARWRENLRAREKEKGASLMPDNHIAVSVVDEAHALINPEHPRAITNSGWPNSFGPQAYHIIRASRVAVFFLDPEQRFRERESTSRSDIEGWAKEFGAGDVTHITLAGAQFRCAGSEEYVKWVEAMLEGKSNAECKRLAKSWAPEPIPMAVVDRAAEPEGALYPLSLAAVAPRRRSSFEFAVCDNPQQLELLLRSKLVGNTTVRLVASFARPWKTEESVNPHVVPAHEQDFFLRWTEGGEQRVWARPWNVIPRNDYSSFIQAAPGSRIAHDQLAEVGCTYAVRGFDFDYVGLLWLGDLQWASNHWTVNLDEVFETGLRGTLKSATRKNNPDRDAREEVMERIKQAYRILLTRAIKGVFVWCEDLATATRLRECAGLATSVYSSAASANGS